jgi:hypothetical protein
METPPEQPTFAERITKLVAQVSNNPGVAAAIKQADAYAAKAIAKVTEMLGRLRTKK